MGDSYELPEALEWDGDLGNPGDTHDTGEGGNSRVVPARYKANGKEKGLLAVKMIPRDQVDKVDLRREIIQLMRVRLHEHIASFRDVMLSRTHLCILMDLIGRENLHGHVMKKR